MIRIAHKEDKINNILGSVMQSPSDDYNEGLVREAVRTYLNNFTDAELDQEMIERVQSGRAI